MPLHLLLWQELPAHKAITAKYKLQWRTRLALSRPRDGQHFPWDPSRFRFSHSMAYNFTNLYQKADTERKFCKHWGMDRERTIFYQLVRQGVNATL